MEDFIIILIGFALMIYSAYSKNKKAKQSKGRRSSADPDASGESASESEASEDILEQFFGYEPQKEESHPFQQADAEAKQTAQQAEKSVDNQKWQTIAERNLKNRKEKTDQQQNWRRQERVANTSHVKRRNASGRKKHQHWFNLRNAVIYSEILNRRY